MTNFFDLLFKTRAKKSDDELGVYPESVHVIALPERRYLWASRLLVLISVFSICFNIMLASILFMMLPNIGSYPQLFYKDRRFNRVELVEPQEIVMDSSDLVAEMLIAEYLFLRHTILPDIDEMRRRWGDYSVFYWYSDPTVYQAFAKEMRDIILAKASEEGQTREIKINWIVNRGQGLWRAEFISYDYTKKSPEPKIMVWRALLRIGFPSRDPLMFEKIAKDNHKAEMMKNPLNFQVKQYVLSSLGDYEPELLP